MTAALKELNAGTTQLAQQATRGAGFASEMHTQARQLQNDAADLTSFLTARHPAASAHGDNPTPRIPTTTAPADSKRVRAASLVAMG
jgi:hypothetical protein